MKTNVAMLTVARVVLAAGTLAFIASTSALAASFEGLGFLGATPSSATAVSADGSVAVGFSFTPGGNIEAFRWESGSLVGLGFLDSGPFYISSATGVSADGSVIVGIADRGVSASHRYLGFRWEGGIASLPDSMGLGSFPTFAVSDDGSVVVGKSDANEASRWVSGARTGLGFLPGDSYSQATSVSADGSVIVGISRISGSSDYEAFRWEDGSMVGLGFPVGGTSSGANDVNADGSVIVGWATGGAFRWEDGVMTSLADQPDGRFHHANAVNADGSVIVGYGGSGGEAVIWDASRGMRSIRNVLVNDFGLDLTGWTLREAFDVSADGNVIVGEGRNPDGATEGWIARLTPAFRWINADGGDWDVSDNWSAGEPPGASDTAEFNLPDTYTVALTASVQAAAVRVDQGDVTFDLAGHAMDLGSVSVGTVPGQSAILRVPDVDNFNVDSIIVGSDENAPAALVLGPDDANPAGTGAGDPGGGSGGTGAFLATTSLVVGHRAQAVVQNVTGELDSITVESGPLPLPYPEISNSPMPAKVFFKNSTINVHGDVLLTSQGDNPGVATAAASGLVMAANRNVISAFTVLSGGSKMTSRSSLSVGAPPIVATHRVVLVVDGNSTLEVLPGGMATVGTQGEAEVKVMNGSMIQAAGADVAIGQNGSGMVEITGQSSMTAESLTLGKNAGSAGEVSVSSTTGTSTVNAPQINVAEQGSGMLRIEDGGRVNSQRVRVTILAPGSGSSSDTIASGQQLPDGAGQLIVNGTGVVSAETIDIGPLGEVSGTGTIEVTEGVFNSGKVKPGASPGTLTIIGPYVQSPDGELEIEFSGMGSGQFDVLSVQGDATIEGTVALQFIDSFAPQQGQQFELLTATGLTDISGAEFEVRNLAPGFMFDIMPSAGGIMMTALNDGVFVPDPIPGDYNADGSVDAADYVGWRKNDGTQEGYDTWRANFGKTAGSGVSATTSATGAIPEPTSWLILVMGMPAIFFRRRTVVS